MPRGLEIPETCPRCGSPMPGEHHPQELPCVYVDDGRVICARCGAWYSMMSHSCFLHQWVEERERWPLPPPGPILPNVGGGE